VKGRARRYFGGSSDAASMLRRHRRQIRGNGRREARTLAFFYLFLYIGFFFLFYSPLLSKRSTREAVVRRARAAKLFFGHRMHVIVRETSAEDGTF